jgi:hypothetical protein
MGVRTGSKETVMSRRAASLVKLLKALGRDESGVILPYVTVMMVAIMGLATLALDAARYTSFQTQMQAAADALALAGARELDGSTGSQTRATNAINSMLTNGLTGFGPSAPTPAAASIAFYSALPVASAGFGGTAATGDANSKYVGVTLSPATVPTILPVAAVSNQLTTSAQAIAGYDFAVCNMPPVFICNPYEQAGDTNSQANNRWSTQVALPANQRQLMKLTVNGGAGYGPGHFGFLVPPDNCNGASCLKDWVATAHPKACYRKKSVDLNTGQMQSVFDYFNVRFDMYGGGVKKTADYAPSDNVRKGYQATSNNWCNASAATPYYTTAAAQSLSLIKNSVTTPVTGDTDNAGNANCKQSTNPCVLKNVQVSVITQVKTFLATANPHIVGTNIPNGATVTTACSATDAAVAGATCATAGANTLIMSSAATAKATGVGLTIGWPTSGLPPDTVFSSNGLGNGQWDCANYWAINHPGIALPSDLSAGGGVCGTPATTNISRFQVYNSERANNLINGYSFPAIGATDAVNSAASAENGAPKCNGPGIAVDAGGGDRRVIYTAIINCVANNALMNQGGQTANNIPVAGFGKFFMTQPVDSGNQILYGEMTGAVGLDKNAKNNVQLYR